MFKVKKSYIVLIIFIGVVLVIASLYSTFAFNSKVEEVGGNYAVTLTGSSEVVTLKGNSSKTVFYRVTNTNRGKVSYGLAYKGSNITVKVYSDYYEDVKGILDYGQSKFTELYIENNSSSENSVTISTVLGYENGGDLIVPSEYTLVTEKYFPLYGLAKYITDLYNKGSKEEVINNNITYRYVPSESLMNDRLGGVTESLDGGNIRYYGASPNNYIYFNCDDYDNQTQDTCELWRIIGIFDGKVKIIRDDNIGKMAWDTNGETNWSKASLNIYLNNTYYNSLKNNVTRDKIAYVTWYLGIIPITTSLYPNNQYKFERDSSNVHDNNPSEWKGKIAIAYASDYSYATDFTKCNKIATQYNDEGCYANDWLFNYTTWWLLSPFGSLTGHIRSDGFLSNYYPDESKIILPTFYLEGSSELKDGTGEEGSPYKLAA